MVNLDKDYLKIIKMAVDDYSGRHEPGSGRGFALRLVQDGHVLLNYCHGQGIEDCTAFPLASVSKPLLAALAIESELDLKSNIKLFFPNLKTDREITVLDLINQTSGIGEYLYAASAEQLNRWSLGEYCEYILTLPVETASRYEYSNSNFVLLTQILETVGRTSYSSQLSTAIFCPLGLRETFSFEEVTGKNEEIAMPHVWNSGQWAMQNLERLCMGYGDSSIFSSVRDLATWLGSSSFKKYVGTIRRDISAPVSKYNRGLFCEIVDDSLALSHSGSMPGR